MLDINQFKLMIGADPIIKYDDFYGMNYDVLIRTMPGMVLVQVDDSDYQGDTRVFWQLETGYAHLIFSWGSCSGCDALQGCDTWDQVVGLRNELYSERIIFANAQEAYTYFTSHDWQGDYSWHSRETREYIEAVITHLKPLVIVE